jgi:hypothetical protein
MRLISAAILGLAVSGCATVTRGTTNQVTVNSEPAGAEAITSTGLVCPMTPCTWEISRKTEFTVTFKKQGYETQQAQVGTKLAGSGAAGFAGNVLIGGIVGMGVDAATGATLEHFPNPVFVTLQPVAIAKAPPPKRRRATPAPAPSAPQS